MIRAIFVFLLLFYFVSFANNLNTLKNWINQYKNSLYISFQQITKIKELEEENKFDGSLCKFKNLLKITYKNFDDTQEILIKGEDSYIYSKTDNTLIITKVDKSLFIYKLFNDILKNFNNFEKNFRIVEKKKSLKIYPKREEEFKEFEITFENNQIKKIYVKDKEGNEIIFYVKDIRKCLKEPTIPIKEDTEIIKQY